MTDGKTVENGLSKRYRKNIRRKFIEGLKEFAMTSPDDKILVPLSTDAQTLLLAKCMQMIAKYSDHPIEVFFSAEKAEKVYEILGLPLSDRADYNKIARPECFDDICTETLNNMFFKGKTATFPVNDGKEIRPLCYVKRKHIISWAENNGFEYIPKSSPADSLYSKLTNEIYDADIRIFRTLQQVDMRFALGYTKEGQYISYKEIKENDNA